MQYKDTIFLPKTSFEMKGNLPTKEPMILSQWEEQNIFKKLREKSKGREKFVLHDGPPYANGHIHMGTALNKILKDVIVRTQQMIGKDSIYVPGWDCHGLPIEWKIEEEYRKKGKNKDVVPIIQFRKECREFAQKWIEIQKKEFRRLGVEGDWNNPYLTMSYEAEAQIVRELGKFLLDGSLYKGAKPVLWSVVEKTALADAEVEYEEHTSNTIYVKFKVTKSKIEKLVNSSILIWTTTPWTIPGNRALAYGKNLEYVLLRVTGIKENSLAKIDDKFVISKELQKNVMNECGILSVEEIHSFKGIEFENTECDHPFKGYGYEFIVKAFEADFVTLEQGTGIVHVAPGHGADDYNLGIKNDVEIVQTVNDDGRYNDKVPGFKGEHVYKVDSKIADKLEELNKLVAKGKLRHSYPHSWRSKAPLIFRNTPQWFISMNKRDLRKKALESIDKTKFYPEQGQTRLRSMIETRPDWCISRQRVWGVPLPIFLSRKNGEPLIDEEVFENIAKIFEQEGSDCWFSDDAQKFLGAKYKSEDFNKISDIVEVWFDSGSTHSYVLEKREDLKWPASMYLEGSDQHRGWFHSSLLESCGTRGRAPFESILSHGFVVDGKGHKMSKSTGNVILPEEVLKKYGADILRIWVASSNYAEDLRIDYSILDQHAESYRKIRNTFRYLLGNIQDSYIERNFEDVNISELPDLEKYILHRIYIINKNFYNYFNSYNFHNLYKELLNFCTVELSAFYFDIRKDLLYCDPINSKKRSDCLLVLNIILNCLLKWFAPILSFTTEEIYRLVNKEGENSIHLKNFLQIPESWKNEELNLNWEIFMKEMLSGKVE